MKAFPEISFVKPSEITSVMSIDGGMDLRDYFAAKALQGLLSLELVQEKISAQEMSPFNLTEAAYDYADLMMKARAL